MPSPPPAAPSGRNALRQSSDPSPPHACALPRPGRSLEKFVADCKSGAFPEAAESYKADGDAEEAIELYGASQQ